MTYLPRPTRARALAFRFPLFAALALALGLAAAPASAEPGAPRWHLFQHERVLGTSLELKFDAPTPVLAAAAESAALAEIDRLAKILSGYDATSEFRAWFATRDEPVRVSPELFEVLALFDTWRARTAGALDPAAEIAGRLWQEAARAQQLPTPAQLAAAAAAARQTHWRLDPVARTATHLTTAPLLLNSFAKSYILDRAATAALAAGQLRTAVVNLGGDLVVRGASAETIALADPLADAENDLPLAAISARDRAVATSGGYRRGVEIGGRWFSHLVDPRTAQPVAHVRSATVVAAHATDAGALATALCVLPEEEGLALVATAPGAECLLVLSDGRRATSPGWSSLAAPILPQLHAAVAPISPAGEGAAALWDAADELVVSFEIAAQGGGRYKRPFVAAWIEDKDGFPLRTVGLWYHGDRWLPDLRAWTRADRVRTMAEGNAIAHSISSATRSPGKYTLKWDGKDAAGQPVPRGKYTVFFEIAREHGTHQLLRREIDFAAGPQHIDFPANAELAALAFDFRRKGETR
ncbi:MAG: hypothetical protein RLZZ15_1963 [Verrucomicrobiota bacterium]|jgi:thiamine biosynthesis lipoprotein ApbE